MMMMNNQYVSDDQWVRTQDPNNAEENPFSLLPCEVFARPDRFKLLSEIDTGGQENMYNKLQSLSQILQTAEATQPGTVDWEAFFEETGRQLVGKKYKKFIRSPAERQMLQMQQMAMQQAAQAQTGAAAPQPNALPNAPGPVPGQGKA
jgi:hypothetical protein